MKKYMNAFFFLLLVDNSYSMTTSLRQVGQRTQTLGSRSYGLGQSRAAEQAVQAEKMRRANEAITEQDRELDEYFHRKPWYRPNQDVFQKRPTFSDSPAQAVSLEEKTDLSFFERLKNAFYSLFTTNSSRTAEQAIQRDKQARFNEWWERQNK